MCIRLTNVMNVAGTSAYHYADPAVFYLRMRGAKTAAMLYSDAEFTSSVALGALNSLIASGSVLGPSSILKFSAVSSSTSEISVSCLVH
jgi:hypothetical protein